MDNKVFDKRIIELNDRPTDESGQCVIYWMQRSQRALDNLALEFAIERANEVGKPVAVYFGLYDRYPLGSARAFQFMLEGLKETARELADRGIGFIMRREPPWMGIAAAADELKACCVVVDEDYLNIGRSWRSDAAAKLGVRLIQIDAETIVPARNTNKEEWGAYTLRPKITRALPDYFREIPENKVEHRWSGAVDGLDIENTDPVELAASLDVDQDVRPTSHFTGGRSRAISRMDQFIEARLPKYGTERNEIGVNVNSDMSPYFHFGQISTLRAALMVDESDAPPECVDAYLEQLIVRRELAINFCLYNPNYDNIEAAADWARATLDKHRADERPGVYELAELEAGRTHDDLWNAAQKELVRVGKIHPYLRMVWAKSLLGWSSTPEDALARAIYLNDKYALDGRDPNGYANIAWCIYGKHDRPFAERPVFGKVRYMSSEATKRKTRWRDYVARIEQA